MTIYAHAFWAWFPFRRRRWVFPLVVGSLLPDVPYLAGFLVMTGRGGSRSVADLTLWDALWKSPTVCALHSFVPWGAATGLFLLWLFIAAGRGGSGRKGTSSGSLTAVGALLA